MLISASKKIVVYPIEAAIVALLNVMRVEAVPAA